MPSIDTQVSRVTEGDKGKTWVDYIQKDLPQHLDWWPYTLGAIPLTLFGLLVTTGLLLTFYYVPSPERAYESVEEITNQVYLGWFIRGLHKTSVDLMILFSALPCDPGVHHARIPVARRTEMGQRLHRAVRDFRNGVFRLFVGLRQCVVLGHDGRDEHGWDAAGSGHPLVVSPAGR